MTRITVPATTANFGAGFDCMGAALTLYNEYRIESDVEGQQIVVDRMGHQHANVRDNLIIQAMNSAFRAAGAMVPGYRLTVLREDIPRSRGLGSSAAAVAAGLLAANALLKGVLNRDTLLRLAVAMEGHPDNVVPCLLGGFRISVVDQEGGVVSLPVKLGRDLAFAVFVPSFSLQTAHARAVLPDTYTRSELVHSLGRAALLMGLLQQGRWEHLREALRDVCHQPYRMPLIPDSVGIFDFCEGFGALGSFISGAGPSLVGLFDPTAISRATLRQKLKEEFPSWELLDLCLDERQALV